MFLLLTEVFKDEAVFLLLFPASAPVVTTSLLNTML